MSTRLEQISYAHMDSPVGKLMIGSSSRGLCKVSFAREVDAEFFSWLEDHFPSAVFKADRKKNDPYLKAIDGYFDGKVKKFNFKLDLVSDGFRKDVLMSLSKVPYGKTVSYGELAGLAGRPRAARAAGSACATNPIAIVIPCHRVIGAGGKLGGYGGGLDHKRYLLRMEGVEFRE